MNSWEKNYFLNILNNKSTNTMINDHQKSNQEKDKKKPGSNMSVKRPKKQILQLGGFNIEQNKNLNRDLTPDDSDNKYGNNLSLDENIEKYKTKYIAYDLTELKKNIPSLNLQKEKVYLISKKDYINGFKLQKELEITKKRALSGKSMYIPNRKNTPFKIKTFELFSSYNKFKDLLQSEDEYVFIKKDYLKLFPNKEIYKDKEILLFQNDKKKYLYFKEDDTLLDISENDNSNKNQENNINIINNEDQNKIQPENNNLNNISKENKNDNPEKNDESDSDIFDINKEKENIIKNLILIYAFEKNINDLMKSSIKDEYDLNEYYLINKEWMKKFKQIFNFNEVKSYIEKINPEYSYKGYLIFLESLTQRMKNKILFDKNLLLKELESIRTLNFFKPQTKKANFENIEEQKDICFPYEFVLVSKLIFDYLFKIIKKQKNLKNFFKYKALIGENAIFLKDKKYNNIFHIYEFNKHNNLEISISFKYIDEYSFYDEVQRFIKNKGLSDYILKRNIDFRSKDKSCDLINRSQVIIGEYINYKQLSENEIKKINIKNDLNKNIILYNYYKEFINNLWKLTDKKINISDIKDIFHSNQNNLKVDFFPVILIPKNHMEHLTNCLFFKEIEEIIKIENEEEKKQKIEITVNKLLASNRDKSEDEIKKIKVINKNEFSSMIRQNYSYTFINKDFMKKIYDSIENILQPIEGFFFINNEEHFILFLNNLKLFKLEYKNKNENEFFIKEYEFNKESKIILNILKKIYKNENQILANISTQLKYMKDSHSFYLINEIFMSNYKKIYNYDRIVQMINYDDNKLYSLINQNKQKPKIDFDSIIPENFNYPYVDFDIPNKFELVDISTFKEILTYNNINNGISSKMNNIYNVSLGDNKVFIHGFSDKRIILIYSCNNRTNNNPNYEIIYIIIMNKNINPLNFLQYCDINQTFEYFITSYGINLEGIIPQVILDENFKNYGEFYSIKPGKKLILEESRHCLGLENIGATCYMNATLQCLCHVFNIIYYFKKERQKIYDYVNNRHCPLTLEFYKVVNNLWKKSYKGRTYYTPTDFKNKISEMNPLFRGIAANDSKDLIIFLYETMHNEINIPNQYKSNNSYNNNPELQLFRNNYYSQNSSFLLDTFYFEQQSDLKCLNCKNNKVSYNITNIFIFPLEKVREYLEKKCKNGFWSVTLENCFENYQEEEYLTGMNMIYCNICKFQTNATTRNTMFTSPEVITIILNRGKGLEFQVEFEYPLTLNIDRFVKDKNSNNNYELIAVLTHIGPSGMAGHFIAFCKSPEDGKWYCYNDADVKEIDDPRYQNNDQIESIPYVLYYQRTDSNKINHVKSFNNNPSYNFQEKGNLRVNQSKNIYNKNGSINYANGNKKDYGYRNNWKKNFNNNSNMITLFFKYNEKEGYLDIDKNVAFYYIIKNLTKKYDFIPKDIILAYEKGNNMITLETYKNPNYYNLKNNDKIIVIKK